ncbi:MAG: lipoate--protein ligase [Luteitalea sp.]|nr:lipoate--protein ligase [Luteitalea sp.]
MSTRRRSPGRRTTLRPRSRTRSWWHRGWLEVVRRCPSTSQPATINVFRQHRIDCCCGGNISLADACVRHDINPDTLLAELRAAIVAAGETRPEDVERTSDHALPGEEWAEVRGYYRQMALIRAFELRAGEMYQRARIGGYCHLNLGEEATVVGLMAALEPRYRDGHRAGERLATGGDSSCMSMCISRTAFCMPQPTSGSVPCRIMPELAYIDNEHITDPRINLAIEEYALRYLDPRYTYVLFYVNEPSIIVGHNQNTFEEINLRYVRDRGIHVVRRLSGGGAVYHDAGNLNFSFITDHRPDRLHNFRFFTEPVVRVLQSMGVAAELQGRNDLMVDGRKISGNAQFSTTRRMFSHGTLLFNSNLEEISHALNVQQDKIQSKGHQRVRNRVANIADYSEKEVDVPTFRMQLLNGIFAGSGVRRQRLSAQDWSGVRRIMERRYARWDWNVGASPRFNVARVRRFAFGEVDARLEVRKGRIDQIHIFGDFLGTGVVRRIEQALRGVSYDPEVLQKALRGLDLRASFPGLPTDAFLALLHPASVREKTSEVTRASTSGGLPMKRKALLSARGCDGSSHRQMDGVASAANKHSAWQQADGCGTRVIGS